MATPRSAAEKLAAKTRFLAALAATRSVQDAAIAAGVDRSSFYRWRQADPLFAAEWDKAEKQGEGPSALEAEAVRRAVIGVQKPVFRGGEVVGHTTDYSDSMLMFLLKAHHPEKYDPKSAQVGASEAPDHAGAKDTLYSKFCEAAGR